MDYEELRDHGDIDREQCGMREVSVRTIHTSPGKSASTWPSRTMKREKSIPEKSIPVKELERMMDDFLLFFFSFCWRFHAVSVLEDIDVIVNVYRIIPMWLYLLYQSHLGRKFLCGTQGWIDAGSSVTHATSNNNNNTFSNSSSFCLMQLTT